MSAPGPGMSVPAMIWSRCAGVMDVFAYAAMMSVPGAVISGLRTSGSAWLGPREDDEAMTGATTPATWKEPPKDAVPPTRCASPVTAAKFATGRCTTGSTAVMSGVVFAETGVFWMITPTAPAAFALATLLTSTLPPRSQTRILPATFEGSSRAATPSAAP